jgi:hypothetical protein
MENIHQHPMAQETVAQPASHRRRRKLVKPGIQLALSGVFAGVSILSLLLQALLFSSLLTSTADRMPVGGNYLIDLMPTLLLRSVLFSLGIVLPLTLAVGVLATFRIAGPVHRFEAFLRAVIQGVQLGPCKIRKGDAFGDLCELINEATEPLRRREAQSESSEASEAA